MSVSIRKPMQPLPEPPLDLKPIPVENKTPEMKQIKSATAKNISLFS